MMCSETMTLMETVEKYVRKFDASQNMKSRKSYSDEPQAVIRYPRCRCTVQLTVLNS